MANHCIDVICLVCGREWCVRGCGYGRDAEPDQDRVKEWYKKNAEWAAKWGQPPKEEKSLKDEWCCGQQRVVIW